MKHQDVCALFLALRHVATGYHIRAVELPRNRRFRIWAERRHTNADGIVRAAADVVLYLRECTGSFCVEMQLVTRKSMPGFCATPVMARPA